MAQQGVTWQKVRDCVFDNKEFDNSTDDNFSGAVRFQHRRQSSSRTPFDSQRTRHKSPDRTRREPLVFTSTNRGEYSSRPKSPTRANPRVNGVQNSGKPEHNVNSYGKRSASANHNASRSWNRTLSITTYHRHGLRKDRSRNLLTRSSMDRTKTQAYIRRLDAERLHTYPSKFGAKIITLVLSKVF